MKYLYMAVTADEYELPVVIGTRQEVARATGLLPDTLTAMTSPSHKNRNGNRKFKIIKIEGDEIDERPCETTRRNSAERSPR